MKSDQDRRSFYTERGVAELLAVSPRTVRRWWASGELPSYKVGAARRFSPDDVRAFIERHKDERRASDSLRTR